MLFFSLESWGTGFANIQPIQVGYRCGLQNVRTILKPSYTVSKNLKKVFGTPAIISRNLAFELSRFSMALSKDRLPGTAMVMNGFQWVTLSQLPWISTQLSPIFGQTQSRLVSYISQKCIIRSPFVVGLIIATFLGQTIKSQIFHLYGTSQAALMAVITKSKNAQQVSSAKVLDAAVVLVFTKKTRLVFHRYNWKKTMDI